jgi:tRNA U34 2-thiouridine synthase MnmA/TrmU
MNLIQRAKDSNKDQTYFIWQIKQGQLPHILFPVGEFDVKSKVREFAEAKGLITSNKPDSQGLCFVGQTSLREMLLQTLGRKDGYIYTYLTQGQIEKIGLTIHKKNKISVNNPPTPLTGVVLPQQERFKIKLGNHEGAFLFTIGQRQNLGLSNGPWFVAEVDIINNEVIVCHNEYQQEIMSKSLIIKDLNWHLDITQESSYTKSRELITKSEKLKVKNAIENKNIILGKEAVILNLIQDLKSSEFEGNMLSNNSTENPPDRIFHSTQDDTLWESYKIFQLTLNAQIRYRSQAQNCQVFVFIPKLNQIQNPPCGIFRSAQDDNLFSFAIVEFDQSIKAAAKGQSIVFYNYDTDQYLIGGGVIESVIKN